MEDLAGTAQMKVSNTSAQLRMLAGAGLVASRRDGVRIYYRLADSGVTAFVGQVQDFAASRLAEVEHAARSYLGDVAALEPVAQDELFRRLLDGQVLVLDVRPAAEYAAGHIPGAVNVPHDQLAARLAQFPGRENPRSSTAATVPVYACYWSCALVSLGCPAGRLFT